MMDKVLSQLSSFLRKIAHLPSIVIWDGFMEYTIHMYSTMETILFSIFSSINLNLIIFVKLFDQKNVMFFSQSRC